jgi:hypothetical protein
MAQQQQIAELRQQRLLRRARTDPERLAAADRALQEGDLDAACLIYARLALSRPESAVSREARDRVARLQQQARRALKQIDAMLTDAASGAAPTRR